MLTVLVVMLAVMLVISLPTWRHSRSWGYVPSGSVGITLVVLIILMLSGRL
jgi:hypothetical protein